MEQPQEQKAPEMTPEQHAKILHESNKVIRHSLAWLHYKMGMQQFYLEEADEAKQARGVLEALCLDLQAKIEAVEPPPKEEKEEEPKKPYVIDAGTVKGSEDGKE